MISVFADGENRHRLTDASGVEIGWIRGRVIGFRGVRTEEDAREAVVAAYPRLESALRQHFPGWPRHEPSPDHLRVVMDGAYEWIADGVHPLARLHRPAHAGDRGLFALEFVLPSYASEGVTISVAQVLGHALRPYLADDQARVPIDENVADASAPATA